MLLYLIVGIGIGLVLAGPVNPVLKTVGATVWDQYGPTKREQ